MGLKKSNWINPNTGDKMRSAYAIVDVVETDGNIANVRFKIAKDRDSAIEKPVSYMQVSVPQVDKSGILYEDIYNYAKQNEFEGWSDDIVEVSSDDTSEE